MSRTWRTVTILAMALGAAACDSTTVPPAGVVCSTARFAGILEPLGMPGEIGIMIESSHYRVTWADGYRPADVNGTVAVVGPDGAIVARAGDRVELTGGVTRAGEIAACGPPRRQ